MLSSGIKFGGRAKSFNSVNTCICVYMSVYIRTDTIITVCLHEYSYVYIFMYRIRYTYVNL